jgi:hypothetical protein
MEIEEISEAEPLKVACYLGLVVGRADAWQMHGATCLVGRPSSKQNEIDRRAVWLWSSVFELGCRCFARE